MSVFCGAGSSAQIRNPAFWFCGPNAFAMLSLSKLVQPSCGLSGERHISQAALSDAGIATLVPGLHDPPAPIDCVVKVRTSESHVARSPFTVRQIFHVFDPSSEHALTF